MLVGLKEVCELILERVNQGVVSAVQKEGLLRITMKVIGKDLVDRICETEEENYRCGRFLGRLSEHRHEWSDPCPSSNEHLQRVFSEYEKVKVEVKQ